jgi:hypothetical protein
MDAADIWRVLQLGTGGAALEYEAVRCGGFPEKPCDVIRLR